MRVGGLWDTLLWSFAAMFTAPSHKIFVRMASAWVLCPGGRTVTRIYQIAEPLGERAHDAYHRFFREGAWSMYSLWRILALALVAAFYRSGRIQLYLDDTVFNKTGPKMAGAGWHRDAVRSTAKETVHAFGLKLVILSIRVNPPWGGEPLSLPVNMRLYRKGGLNLIELAHDAAIEVASWFEDRLFDLCADGFYFSLAGYPLERISFTCRMRKDAALYEPPPQRREGQRGRPRKKGKRLPSLKEMAASGVWWKHVTVDERGKERERLLFCRKVLWYGVCPDRQVLLVISRDPHGKEKDDNFFTTNLSASPEEVVYRYSGRWSIEDTFRNTKQHLGGQEPQTWKGEGPQRVAAFSFFLYSVIWLWYIQAMGMKVSWIPLPWYPKKKNPSFIDALASLRRVLWRRVLFPTSGSEPLPDKIADTLIHVLSRAA